MREIKFRGKRNYNGEWVYGFYVRDSESSGYIFGDYFDNGEVFDIDPETVGQFTGLHDKNGKEIYEGDVVRQSVLLSGDMVDNPVKWIVCGFVANGLLGKREAENCEVIGNIHEYPELING